MEKTAVIIYGPPGSGKGTQAYLLSNRFGFIHFDTGRYLEKLVHNSKSKSKIIKRERELFDKGELMTPSFVFAEVRKAVNKISMAGYSIVLSGSPRTIYEAERLMPVMDKLYGKRNIFIFYLDVPEEVSIKRNSSRIVCSVCGNTLLTAYYPSKHPKYCPICAGPFYRRSVDNKDTIKVRLNEYNDRTKPVLKFFKNKRYKFYKVDGTPPPYKVFFRISKVISRKTH